MKQIHFILIDDDSVHNMLCSLTIRRTLGDVKIHEFTLPEEGFDFFRSIDPNIHSDHYILLLDINMPIMTGWEFLQEFEKLEKEIKEKVTIYILSSSIDNKDIFQAEINNYVTDFILKPLDKNMINQIYHSAIKFNA